MSAFRVVMVTFVPDATEQDIAWFHEGLRALADNTPGLLSMVSGVTCKSGDENALSAQAPDATYGDFASIWEFESTESLAAFVDSPTHHALARKRFKRVVRHRYVFNLTEEQIGSGVPFLQV